MAASVVFSPVTSRLLPSVPHSQSWVLSQDANKKSGTCSVCFATRQLHNKDGTIHIHGPRDNPCAGSHLPPLSQSIHTQQSISVSQMVQPVSFHSQVGVSTIIASSVSTTSTPLPAVETKPSSPASDVVKHPPHMQILKRIPKGARPAAASLLQKLLKDVVLHPTSTTSWSKLLAFSSSCLVKPNRGGKTRNLTTSIVKLVREYDLNSKPCLETLDSQVFTNRRYNSSKSADETTARMASVKLEDSDIKGAVRLLCSEDTLASENSETFNKLCSLHPAAPVDRRQAPSTTMQPLQVSSAAVRAAIQSFPNGSAAGPDGLRPQHLKDLLQGCSDVNPLMDAITDFTNLLLTGKTPTSVRGAIFGANLLAIAKKSGGIRPIAVGYVWRRLAAKVACNHVQDASAALLAPRQLGFGVKGGAEAAVRAARCYVENMKSGQLFIKIDFKNAFNTLRRDSILEAVAKHFPELLHFAASTIDSPSDLQFGKFTVQSEEGAQQGDPLGPLYFCLVFKEILESLCSELVLGYLDDVAMGDTASIVLSDFISLEKTASRFGLEMNRSKCEVVGHTTESRKLFEAHGVLLPEISSSAVILLGAPLSAGQHLDAVLEGKREDLLRLSRRLKLMPSHDSLYLLRNVFTSPRLMYLLRTAPCTDSPVLPSFDATIRESLSATLNVELSDVRWAQASLPVRWGGLGVRSVVLLAPSAYLASAASTAELTSSLLPAHLRDIEDSGTAIALSTWMKQASSPAPLTPLSKAQRNWDDVCCKVQAESLLNGTTDFVERARLIASCSSGSGDWLNTLPLASVGLKMDNSTVRIAAGLRLGAPIVRSHICVCGKTVTEDGHHGLSCRFGSGRHSRHNQLNDLLCRAFISTGTLATREPHSLCTRDNKRPDGVTQVPWKRGRCLAWDATCPDTFAQSYVQASSNQAGSAAAAAEEKKIRKYSDIVSGVDFSPVAIETSGVWGERALELVTEIGRRIAAVTHEPRSTTFLRQRLSVAVQRGNAMCVLGTFANSSLSGP